MNHTAYLLLVTSTKQLTGDDVQFIRNSTGFGYAIYGSSTAAISQSLWFIRRPQKDPDAIHQAVSSIPSVTSVTIVPLDIPIKDSQISLIRILFKQLNWEDAFVTDTEIASYFTDELQGSKTQYIHFSHQSDNTQTITFKSLKDLPDYSPDWEQHQQKFNEAINSGLLDNMDHSKLNSIRVEVTEIVEENIEVINIPPPKNQI